MGARRRNLPAVVNTGAVDNADAFVSDPNRPTAWNVSSGASSP